MRVLRERLPPAHPRCEADRARRPRSARAVTAKHLGRLEARIATTDVDRDKDRITVAAGVAIAVAIAGLDAIAGMILAIALGRAGMRYVRRELAVGALLELERRRGVDLRAAAPR